MSIEEFQDITYQGKTKTLFVRVNTSSQFATEEDVKKAHYGILEAIRVHHPAFLLINVKDLRFPVSLELQDWISDNILPELFVSQIKIVAYVMPAEFIENLSIEQVVDGLQELNQQEGMRSQIDYFDNEKQALEWFAASVKA